MFRSLLGAFALMMAGVGVVSGQVIVFDDFESYVDDDDLFATWVPSIGNGSEPLPDTDINYDGGILTTDAGLFPGIDGQAVDHLGSMVNQYLPGAEMAPQPGFPLLPTVEKSILLQGDIHVTALGRMSIGLRNRQDEFSPDDENIIELGINNGNFTALAHRGILFPPPSDPNPNWQYFSLPAGMDRPDDGDEITQLADVVAYATENELDNWHRYRAIITPETVTYELDLFRDDMDTVNGVPGVDASATYNLVTTAAGYDSLRIGAPSGITSATGVAFDNILLELIDVAPPEGLPGDFNENNVVDAADYTLFQDNFGSLTPLPNDNGLGTPIGEDHYNLWVQEFGTTAAGSGLSASASIPEPTTLLLLVVSLAGQLLVSRRRLDRC